MERVGSRTQAETIKVVGLKANGLITKKKVKECAKTAMVTDMKATSLVTLATVKALKSTHTTMRDTWVFGKTICRTKENSYLLMARAMRVIGRMTCSPVSALSASPMETPTKVNGKIMSHIGTECELTETVECTQESGRWEPNMVMDQ